MTKERLVCNLTVPEKIDRAQKATELLGEYGQKEREAKAAAATRSAELKELRSSLDEAGRASREGWEYREVEVRERPKPANRTVEVVRMDTDEVVRSRPMTEAEWKRWRQPDLPSC